MKKLKRIDLKKMQNIHQVMNDQELAEMLGGYIQNTDWACLFNMMEYIGAGSAYTWHTTYIGWGQQVSPTGIPTGYFDVMLEHAGKEFNYTSGAPTGLTKDYNQIAIWGWPDGTQHSVIVRKAPDAYGNIEVYDPSYGGGRVFTVGNQTGYFVGVYNIKK